MAYQYFFMNFKWLSAKQRGFLRDNDIFMHFLLFLSSMFEYKGMDPEINTDFIEFYNIIGPEASCGVFKRGNHEILGYATEGGLLNDYGIPEKFNINTLGTNNAQGLIDGVNTAICWNNSIHRTDLVKLERYTELFSLVDTAQKCLMRYARLFPVFEVQDSIVENELKKSLKNADNGEPFTFTSKALSKLGVDGTPGVNIFRLGDYEAVDKIQYLSTYHNDLLRRFYSMYGMAYSQSMKAAQQSVEEVTSDRIVSWIIPENRLKERKKFIDKYNRVFGHSATVEFSDAWLKGYKQYMRSGEDPDQENGGDHDEN